MSENLVIDNIYLSVLDGQNVIEKVQLATDVVVTMKNKSKYLATFYTYEYLKNKIIEEQSKMRLYWCMDSFTLVESLDSNSINEIVEKMIDCGDFQIMFLKLD